MEYFDEDQEEQEKRKKMIRQKRRANTSYAPQTVAAAANSLDFSDADNSMYVALIERIF